MYKLKKCGGGGGKTIAYFSECAIICKGSFVLLPTGSTDTNRTTSGKAPCPIPALSAGVVNEWRGATKDTNKEMELNLAEG